MIAAFRITLSLSLTFLLGCSSSSSGGANAADSGSSQADSSTVPEDGGEGGPSGCPAPASIMQGAACTGTASGCPSDVMGTLCNEPISLPCSCLSGTWACIDTAAAADCGAPNDAPTGDTSTPIEASTPDASHD